MTEGKPRGPRDSKKLVADDLSTSFHLQKQIQQLIDEREQSKFDEFKKIEKLELKYQQDIRELELKFNKFKAEKQEEMDQVLTARSRAPNTSCQASICRTWPRRRRRCLPPSAATQC